MKNIYISANYQLLSNHVALKIGSYIRYKPNALICIASGDSTVGVCQALVKHYHLRKFDIEHVTFVGLDEWVGMDEHDDGSCKSSLYKHLFNQLPLRPEQIQYFDAKAVNLVAECEQINAFIASKGGLDVMLVGVGLNGHIALNEPGTPFDSYAHVADLDEMTISVGQKYFTKETPLSQGLTVGLRHLKEAKLPILVANGVKKLTLSKKP